MSRFVPFCPAPKNVPFKKMPERRTKRDKTGHCPPPPPPPFGNLKPALLKTCTPL